MKPLPKDNRRPARSSRAKGTGKRSYAHNSSNKKIDSLLHGNTAGVKSTADASVYDSVALRSIKILEHRNRMLTRHSSHLAKQLDFSCCELERQEAQEEIRNRRLAKLTHQLRNALVAVRGYVRLILTGGAGQLTDSQNEFLTLVAANANQLVDIADVLEILQTPSDLCLRFLDVSALTQEVTESLPGNINCEIDRGMYSNAASFFTIGDSEMLRAMLRTVLLRMTDGNNVSEPIRINLSIENGELVLRIACQSNANAPISPKMAPSKIESQSTVPVDLHSVRMIVELHGGQIVETRSCGQSRTKITLPIIRFSGDLHTRVPL